jgi:hypothetical protein
VRPRTEAPDAVREAVPRRLRELGMRLAARGFKVIVDADRWCLTVVNRAAAPDDPSDPLAIAYGPLKLVQSVYLAVDDTGDLCWYWQWSGPTRGGSGEYERLCPAAATAEATERISRVPALRDELAGADE